MAKEIKKGFTNISYHDEQYFYQDKQLNEFNHKINYQILSKFDFVPQFYSEISNEKTNVWEYIPNNNIVLDNDTIVEIANILRQVHNSKLSFPKFNLSRNIKKMILKINAKKLKIAEIDKYYRKVNLILTKIDKITPIHNDVWPNNFFRDLKTNKLYLSDWEYASLGDKHYDLAYFIESAHLNDEQETLFLDAYQDDYQYSYILQNRFLVNYFVILTLNSADTKIFDDQKYKDNLPKLERMYHDWINKEILDND